MRLLSIEIENFKAIGVRQRIDLHPITLLFGPNSAGKSTIFQAINYAFEVLANGKLTPNVGNLEAVDEENFRSVVHGNDLSKSIKIKLEAEWLPEDLSIDEELFTYLRFDAAEETRINSEHNILVDRVVKERLPLWGALAGEALKSFGIEFAVSWCSRRRQPYVSCWTAFFNSCRICSIKSGSNRDGEDYSRLVDFNFEHHLLGRGVLQNDGSYDLDLVSESPLIEFIKPVGRNRSRKSPADFCLDLNLKFPFCFAQSFNPRVVEEHELEEDKGRDEWYFLHFRSVWKPWFFDSAFLLAQLLSNRMHIGPVRDIPKKSVMHDVSQRDLDWREGRAAWISLWSDGSEALLGRTNRWLSGEDKLSLPYRVRIRENKVVPMESLAHEFLMGNGNGLDFEQLKNAYASYPVHKELLVDDLNNRVSLGLNEVGTGVSQVLPIIVGCFASANNILCVEQPELHLHPGAQVGLGDLFVEAVQLGDEKVFSDCEGVGCRKLIVAETHSEHLILRLLRRIRETSEGALPPGISALRKEDLAVIYAEPTSDGVRYKTLRVDDDGEFLDAWPRGFFEERGAELF